MDRWKGRVALVTGCSKGIGIGIVRELARHGMKVVACARNIQRIEELRNETMKTEFLGEVIPVKCDLRREDEILKMFEFVKNQYGGVDVCVNNAAIWHPSKTANLISGETDKWREMLEVNILALCICSREAIKSMRERNVEDGHIINLGSITGHRLALRLRMLYAVTKHATRTLTEGLRLELRQAGSRIRVSSISPGLVVTEIVPTDRPTPFRYLDISDVVEAVIFVLSTKPHVEINDILLRTNEQKL